MEATEGAEWVDLREPPTFCTCTAILRGLCTKCRLSLSHKTETLSGEEVPRVKLASELHRQGRIYVLDEPSTGLHSSDIEKLLALLRKLVNNGNTVVIVEHRPELINQATG